jgi:hypothetical protein
MREQQMLLEHVADTALLGRDIDSSGRIEEHAMPKEDPAAVRVTKPGDQG